jgi:hypothetical protein
MAGVISEIRSPAFDATTVAPTMRSVPRRSDAKMGIYTSQAAGPSATNLDVVEKRL